MPFTYITHESVEAENNICNNRHLHNHLNIYGLRKKSMRGGRKSLFITVL